MTDYDGDPDLLGDEWPEPTEERTRAVWVENHTGAAMGWTRTEFTVMDFWEKPTPQLRIFAWKGEEEVDRILKLGDSLTIAGENYRLVEIHSPQGGKVAGKLWRTDGFEGEVPLVSDVFETAEFVPFGTLEPAQMGELQRRLGQPLPALYATWLRSHNGAKPVRPYKLGDLHLTMTPATPLYGMHPGIPDYDLIEVNRRYRDRYFTPEHIIVAEPYGGLLTVSSGGKTPADGLSFLHESAMGGVMDPRDRERFLKPAGLDIYWFLGVLTPFDLPS